MIAVTLTQEQLEAVAGYFYAHDEYEKCRALLEQVATRRDAAFTRLVELGIDLFVTGDTAKKEGKE